MLSGVSRRTEASTWCDASLECCCSSSSDSEGLQLAVQRSRLRGTVFTSQSTVRRPIPQWRVQKIVLRDEGGLGCRCYQSRFRGGGVKMFSKPSKWLFDVTDGRADTNGIRESFLSLDLFSLTFRIFLWPSCGGQSPYRPLQIRHLYTVKVLVAMC